MTHSVQPGASSGGVSYARKFFGWAILAWQVLLLIMGAALGRLVEVIYMVPFWLLLAWALLHDWKRDETT